MVKAVQWLGLPSEDFSDPQFPSLTFPPRSRRSPYPSFGSNVAPAAPLLQKTGHSCPLLMFPVERGYSSVEMNFLISSRSCQREKKIVSFIFFLCFSCVRNSGVN